jgi:hypothetical protein
MNMFFVIGAQKSGTTALWQYLRMHPEVNMPLCKEAPYFASRAMRDRGWDQFWSEYFPHKQSAKIAGTATPQYMCHPDSAKHIAQMFPKAKLIALLRNPIHRAVSHYKMAVQRGHETRPFSVAITEQLRPEALNEARMLDLDSMAPDEHINAYLAWGEYKRMMQTFRICFSDEQFLFLTHQELLRDRARALEKVLKFLGVDDQFVPPNLNQEFHTNQPRAIRSVLSRLAVNVIKSVAKPLVPKQTHRALKFWVKTTLQGGHSQVRLPKSLYEDLRSHFDEDIIWVKRELGLELDDGQSVDRDLFL